MNISKTKIAYYLLTFQKRKIPGYLLGVANGWVANELQDATRERIAAVLVKGKSLHAALVKYAWLCPAKWHDTYALAVEAFGEVVAACEDLQITDAEFESVCTAFKRVYAKMKGDAA